MKKKIYIIIILLLSCFILNGCISKNTVTFVYNNETIDEVVNVSTGKSVSKPSNPIKENYIFMYWCSDSALNNEYDFSKSVYKDITLYAKYIPDYAKITNLITATTMKSNVTVYATNYNTIFGITTDGVINSGSGIIFKETESSYYVLTNNHVTVKHNDYQKVRYEIEDYKGNKTTGKLVYEDPTFDLACLYFSKSEELKVIELAKNNPLKNDEVIALGQPKNQNNAISYGIINEYKTIKLSNSEEYISNVTFPCICHNAPIASGSSGGALLNMKLQLIGINYAGSETKDGEFVNGFAIPIEKVYEFITLCNI